MKPKRQTIRTAIRELLAEYPADTRFNVHAHELWRDGSGWTSNDRWRIASRDATAAEVVDACAGRWEVFKLNYNRKARVADVATISEGGEYGHSLECGHLPFVDIVPV